MMAVASGVSLADHNTLGLQASAEWFASVRNREELDAALNFASERQLPVRALGEGSNVILHPRLPGLVLHMALNNTKPTPEELMQTVMAVRTQRLPDPAVVPNVGSFFKNPIVSADFAETLGTRYPALPVYPAAAGSTKLSAAWMIDQLGWRGREQGGVAVSEAHSLVLVNRGADTAEAVLALASAIQASVLDEFGVALELEPQLLGEAGD